ncbi:MAG TPA: quinone-dependent dihydroorotate dehydrogenase [Pyrinomonadaceae bacterium]|nr:quinone-dependent dihydroorotate dehydrogenase [Pyrinomonadaceae bacterium]
MVYRSLLRPLLFRLPPETAHYLALHSLAVLPGAKAISQYVSPEFHSDSLRIERFGLKFSNPIGLAAGFDKDGIALPALAALGFGFIEAGTVTFHAQPGNPRPRLFRLPKDMALINRAGFNNQGAAAFAARVKKDPPDCVLGVSIGKSKIAPLAAATADYLSSFDLVYPVADYIAVNVSSPNTPQLRELQQADQLTSLFSALQARNLQLQAQHKRPSRVPLLVKLAPDLEFNELELIVDVVKRLQIDGIIATNTTIKRENLRTPPADVAECGAGGLSGLPLKQKATTIIANLHQLTNGQIPLVGVGGVFTAADAWEKISAGASLVQLYTGFIYQGPAVARDINRGVADILRREGLRTLDQAIGCRAAELADSQYRQVKSEGGGN